MDINTRVLKGVMYKPFGGLNITFSGDYSQLEPPRTTPVYVGDICPAFHCQVNAYIELTGHHRFKDDPAWGELLGRFRIGKPRPEDINLINDTCMVSDTREVPPNTPIAVYVNRNRDALNSAMFEDYCAAVGTAAENPTAVSEDAMLVFMTDLEMNDESKTFIRVTSNAVKKHFYSCCGEDACETTDRDVSRVDPVLKLYPGCPLMFTENSDVDNGQANGSRVTLVRVNVKAAEQPIPLELECGTTVPAYFANQIISLTVRHEVDDIVPQEFDVTARVIPFKTTMTFDGQKKLVRMKGTQFTLISNSTTTGHKLQGCTLDRLLVAEWHYKANWPYVVLSRVRTMLGLFLTQKLSTRVEDYAMPERMLKMIQDFKDRVGLRFYTHDEYTKTLRDEIMLQQPDPTLLVRDANVVLDSDSD
jgi:hypothetical protein